MLGQYKIYYSYIDIMYIHKSITNTYKPNNKLHKRIILNNDFVSQTGLSKLITFQ